MWKMMHQVLKGILEGDSRGSNTWQELVRRETVSVEAKFHHKAGRLEDIGSPAYRLPVCQSPQAPVSITIWGQISVGGGYSNIIHNILSLSPAGDV